MLYIKKAVMQIASVILIYGWFYHLPVICWLPEELCWLYLFKVWFKMVTACMWSQVGNTCVDFLLIVRKDSSLTAAETLSIHCDHFHTQGEVCMPSNWTTGERW